MVHLRFNIRKLSYYFDRRQFYIHEDKIEMILIQFSQFFFVILVPIIPEFLYDINHPDAPLDSPIKSTTTTAKPQMMCPGSRQDIENLYDNLTTTEFPSMSTT